MYSPYTILFLLFVILKYSLSNDIYSGVELKDKFFSLKSTNLNGDLLYKSLVRMSPSL